LRITKDARHLSESHDDCQLVPGKRTRETYIEFENERIRILELKKAVAAEFEVPWHGLAVFAFDGTELRDRQDFDPLAHGGCDDDRCLTVKLEGVLA
jgi:hypothetical protein